MEKSYKTNTYTKTKYVNRLNTGHKLTSSWRRPLGPPPRVWATPTSQQRGPPTPGRFASTHTTSSTHSHPLNAGLPQVSRTCRNNNSN